MKSPEQNLMHKLTSNQNKDSGFYNAKMHQKKAKRWRRRFNDAFRASLFIFAGLSALAGIAVAALISGDISPMQIKVAQLILRESGQTMILALGGIAALYLTKNGDFSEIYATPPEGRVARFLETHPIFIPVPSLLVSIFLSFWLIAICAFPIAMPILIGGYFLKAAPMISDDLICEAELWRNLQQSAYQPSIKCQNIISRGKTTPQEQGRPPVPADPALDMRQK